MNDNLFKEYKIRSKVDNKIINKYKGSVLIELIYVWESY